MSSLFLGLLGGFTAGGSSILGALTPVWQNQSLILEEHNIERKLGFILGFLYLLTSFSYLNPTLERTYHGGLAKNYEVWSVFAAFVAGLLLMLLLSEILHENVSGERTKQENVKSILSILLKNIPQGMAAGAVINMNHTGISYSLLSFIGIHQLFQGAVLALGLMKLGLEAELTFVGSVMVAFVAVIAAIFGSVISQEHISLMPVMLAIAGGCMVSAPIEFFVDKCKSAPERMNLSRSL